MRNNSTINTGINKISNGVNKEIIRNNFTKWARFYDQYCQIQNLCAAELIAAVKTNGFRNILDIGCGTANFTLLLKAKFPFARIKAIDISEGMIRVSQEKLKGSNIEFIAADAEDFEFKEKFDLIGSNAAFQWLADPAQAFNKYAGFLKRNGLILFSLFGPLTFRELNAALKEYYQEKVPLSVNGFLDKTATENSLMPFFKNVKIKEEIYKKEYSSLAGLLKSIKYTGTRGSGLFKDRIWTAYTLNKIENIYRRRFRKIIATYQVFFCQGRK